MRGRELCLGCHVCARERWLGAAHWCNRCCCHCGMARAACVTASQACPSTPPASWCIPNAQIGAACRSWPPGAGRERAGPLEGLLCALGCSKQQRAATAPATGVGSEAGQDEFQQGAGARRGPPARPWAPCSTRNGICTQRRAAGAPHGLCWHRLARRQVRQPGGEQQLAGWGSRCRHSARQEQQQQQLRGRGRAQAEAAGTTQRWQHSASHWTPQATPLASNAALPSWLRPALALRPWHAARRSSPRPTPPPHHGAHARPPCPPPPAAPLPPRR